jgi:hypothetical protein
MSAVHESASGGTCTCFFLFSTSAICSNERVGSFSSVLQILLRQPKSMLLQKTLHEAVVGFLSAALFGPARQTYWRRRLAGCANKQPAAPVGERFKEVTTEVADLAEFHTL